MIHIYHTLFLILVGFILIGLGFDTRIATIGWMGAGVVLVGSFLLVLNIHGAD